MPDATCAPNRNRLGAFSSYPLEERVLFVLTSLMNRIAPLDDKAMQAAADRQNTLTKPQGSLGRLEELSIQLAGIAITAWWRR